jgi:pimeloyl-ACP methyl ester carboxylesterase
MPTSSTAGANDPGTAGSTAGPEQQEAAVVVAAPSSEPVAGTVRSADGTVIAYERSGTGPAVILVDGAGSHRAFGPLRPLARLLSARLTVVTYDRRGRGESTDTPPYAVAREVEDVGALLGAVGGSASLYGVSSGALLALQAAAGGLRVPRLALFEPPIGSPEDEAADARFTRRLAELVAAGRRAEAVDLFHRSIGVPEDVIASMGPSRASFEAVAHTLVYDCLLSEATTLALVASVTAPTLVLGSEGSSGDLTGWAAAVMVALPDGRHRSLEGGWHGVRDEDLSEVLGAFFAE